MKPINLNSMICYLGVGPQSELKRLQKDGLVLNSEQVWTFNEELGKNMHDHSFSQMTFQVPNVPDFAFRWAVHLLQVNSLQGNSFAFHL